MPGRLRNVKLVLLSVLLVGLIGSVTVRGVYGLLSSQSSATGSSISSGTLTMENLNFGDTMQSTLSAAVTASATTISVAGGGGPWPAAPFTVVIDSEQLRVTATGASWTVTRGINGTTAAAHSSGANATLVGVAGGSNVKSNKLLGTTTLASAVPETTLAAAVPETTLAAAITNSQTTIAVASGLGFPTSGNFTIQIDSEQMTVTAGQGTTMWTVTRHVNGTTAAAHGSGANVDPATIAVSSASGFPASGSYTVYVGSEQMTVTAGQGTTTWRVTRHANSTTSSSLTAGTAVDPATITVSSTASFPAVGGAGSVVGLLLQVDNEVMQATALSGSTYTVTRGVDGTAITSHAAGATVLQKSVYLNSTSGFPTSGDFTVDVDSEKMLVVGTPAANRWTVVRAVDGTAAASHAANAAVSVGSACASVNGTSNAVTGCDSLLAWAPDTEAYPGSPLTSGVAITDSGSLGVSDLQVYMPTCLRGITPDAPFASSAPSISSFSAAATTGGHLVGGTTYYYEVTAIVGGTESVAGAESAYTPPSGTSTNAITLKWGAVSGATGYKVYRSTSEGGEQLLASVGAVTSYTDASATVPSGSPPSGTGSGDPCQTGNSQLYVQETSASGAAQTCWYPASGTSCSFDATHDLGYFAQANGTLGTALDLAAGPTATEARYFQIGLQFPSGATNALQGTEADFTLHWYARS